MLLITPAFSQQKDNDIFFEESYKEWRITGLRELKDYNANCVLYKKTGEENLFKLGIDLTELELYIIINNTKGNFNARVGPYGESDPAKVTFFYDKINIAPETLLTTIAVLDTNSIVLPDLVPEALLPRILNSISISVEFPLNLGTVNIKLDNFKEGFEIFTLCVEEQKAEKKRGKKQDI